MDTGFGSTWREDEEKARKQAEEEAGMTEDEIERKRNDERYADMTEEERKAAKEAEEKAALLSFMQGFQKVKKLEDIHGDAGEAQREVHKEISNREKVKLREIEKAKQ